MSAIAAYLLARGVKITGSDAARSAYTDNLKKSGALVGIPDGAEYMSGCGLVVANSAIKSDHPELVAARERGIPVGKREEVLGAIFDGYAKNIAVCGMHGKTTTSAMIAHCLWQSGYDPTAFVGGIVNGFGSNFLDGKSQVCVAEACEYKASFLHLHPLVNCMLNVDSDHLDFYKNIDDISAAFKKFAANTKTGGVNIVNGDDAVLKNFDGIKFGLGGGNDYTAKNLAQEKGCFCFDIYRGKVFEMNVKLKVAGRHNVLNALCAYCALDFLGAEKQKIKDGLESFDGVERRCRITKNRFSVIVDYAHHPREIATLLDTVSLMGYDRVRLVFQPHTYTRTKGLFDDFVKTLAADEVYIIPTYAAREEVIAGYESIDLAMAMEKQGVNVQYFENLDKLTEVLKEKCGGNDAVLLVGAGDVDRLADALLD